MRTFNHTIFCFPFPSVLASILSRSLSEVVRQNASFVNALLSQTMMPTPNPRSGSYELRGRPSAVPDKPTTSSLMEELHLSDQPICGPVSAYVAKASLELCEAHGLLVTIHKTTLTQVLMNHKCIPACRGYEKSLLFKYRKKDRDIAMTPCTISSVQAVEQLWKDQVARSKTNRAVKIWHGWGLSGQKNCHQGCTMCWHDEMDPKKWLPSPCSRVQNMLDFLLTKNAYYISLGVTFSSENSAALFTEDKGEAFPDAIEIFSLEDEVSPVPDSLSDHGAAEYTP
ncbi:hypothetical protein B0H19DRAFT_1067799 [Mycena capillaripes]|nr:hypothetical protein B0H19DRAFT_1067799 [Mycena capillaripes]